MPLLSWHKNTNNTGKKISSFTFCCHFSSSPKIWWGTFCLSPARNRVEFLPKISGALIKTYLDWLTPVLLGWSWAPLRRDTPCSRVSSIMWQTPRTKKFYSFPRSNLILHGWHVITFFPFRPLPPVSQLVFNLNCDLQTLSYLFLLLLHHPLGSKSEMANEHIFQFQVLNKSFHRFTLLDFICLSLTLEVLKLSDSFWWPNKEKRLIAPSYLSRQLNEQ